jgi:hypothetical protein
MASNEMLVEEFIAVDDLEGEFSEPKLVKTTKVVTPKAKRPRVSV